MKVLGAPSFLFRRGSHPLSLQSQARAARGFRRRTVPRYLLWPQTRGSGSKKKRVSFDDPRRGNDDLSAAVEPFFNSSKQAQPEGQASTSHLPPDQAEGGEVLNASWSRLETVLENHLRHYTHWKCVKDKYPGLDLDTLLNYTDCAKELADEAYRSVGFVQVFKRSYFTDYVKNINNIRGNLHLFQVMIELHHAGSDYASFSKNRLAAG